MQIARSVIAVAFVLACWATDIRARRIPNALSASGVVAGLLLSFLASGASGMVHSLAGMAVSVGVLFGPFALGGIGAGDVKMMAAIGALLGPAGALAALVAGFMIGGVIMAVHLARVGRLHEKIRATYGMVVAALLQRSLAPLKMSAQDTEAIALPYSVPLGLATMAVLLFLNTGTP